jgi:uncharacterized protein YcfJ
MQHTLISAVKAMIGVAGIAVAAQTAGQVTMYSRDNFSGRSFHTDRNVGNMERVGFNDLAASVVIEGGSWQLCEDAGFNGRCVVLGPGEYRSLWDMGLDREVSSVRAVDDRAAANDGGPPPRGGYDYHRRGGERLYEAQVTSVHAVVGPPETRCWVERQQFVEANRSAPNVAGAIAGAVIGGILGHQIGSGRGNDIATAGGAVAGAAIGANVDRGPGGANVYDRDVQRCTSVPSNARPAFWDVTYTFRGETHRIQTDSPPGPTVTVNGDGEPRL